MGGGDRGDGGLTAAFDSDARNEILDDEGVAAEVLFPDADVLGTGRIASSPFGTGLAGAGDNRGAGHRRRPRPQPLARRLRRPGPERRIGVAVIPAIIPDMDTVLELVREAKELGHRGIMIPTRWFDRPAYHDPIYEPLWALTEELGLVLHTHSGAGPTDIGLGPGMLPIYATEAGWWAARPLWVLIWGGVFERHPDLKYSIAENGAWWVPDRSARWTRSGSAATTPASSATCSARAVDEAERVPRPQLLPRRVDPGRRRHRAPVPDRRRQPDVGQRLPPPRGHVPVHALLDPRAVPATCPRRRPRRCSALTAAEVYGVDVDALRPLVERIGPTLDEVHGDAPLPRVPAGV